MNATQIAAYRAETARIKAAEVGRTDADRERVAAHDRAVRAALQVLRDADHEQAELDDMPCELCGEVEQHIRHRGIGHTHTPAGPDVPAYVVGVIRGMWSANCWTDVVDIEHDAALVEYRRVLAGRRLDRACEICSDDQRANHSNRDHDQVLEHVQVDAILIDREIYPLLRGGQL